MTRLLTALVAVPLALAAVFRLPGGWFFLAILVLVEVAVLEYVRLGRRLAAGVPLLVLVGAVPLLAFVATFGPSGWSADGWGLEAALLAAALVPLAFGPLVLFSSAPLAAAVSGVGLLAFGLPYFTLPIVSMCQLQRRDPWLLLLLLVLVWVGDTAAFYIGTRWGRHKLAPVVSPNKSWQGAVAGLVAALMVAVGWSVWRWGAIDARLLSLAGLAALAGQIGDLVESMLKRAAGVKDSGALLPGHGGVLDRIDALLFAAPVWHLGLHFSRLLPPSP